MAGTSYFPCSSKLVAKRKTYKKKKEGDDDDELDGLLNEWN
jgi:hypothetical protein